MRVAAFRTAGGLVKTLLMIFLVADAIGGKAVAQDQIVYDDALQNGWQNYGWATINYSSTAPVHSGADSISVIDPGTSYQAMYLHHAAFGSSPYQSLSFWVYPTTAGNNQLHVQGTLNGNPQPAVNLSFTAAQTNTWQQITIPLTNLGVTNSTGFDGFWIQNNTGTPLTFYVDDIKLVAIAVPNPVIVTVNPQSVTRTIDGRIYGVNVAIWDSLLSGSASAASLAAVGTQVIRFPGGSSSDDYDWQTDRSVSNGSFQWTNNAVTFAGVAQARGAQAYVTVNYGSGTPEEAAAWVAYYNGVQSNQVSLGKDSKGRDWKTVGYWASIRAASPLGTDDGYNFLRASHAAPYGFHYWEVGNECYGSWEYDQHGTAGSGLSGVAHDAYTYAQAFQNFYTEMLAVDPTIRIGAVSIPGEDAYGNSTHAIPNPNENNTTHTGWTPVMLATLKSLGLTPHFLIHHSYAQEPGNEDDATLLQSGANLGADAANLRKMITDYANVASGAGIELALTELNSVSSNPGKQSVSLVNGLFMVDAIGQLVNTEFNACTWWAFRNGSSAGNNSPSLYGWRLFGDYGLVASGDRGDTAANTPYPAFYAASLLTKWGRGGDRVVNAATNYSLLSAYAAKLANGNMALLVVNKHPSSDLVAQISLTGFTTGTTAGTVYSYGKQNDLANSVVTTGTFNNAGSNFTYTFPSYSMSVLVLKGQFEQWREQNFSTTQLADPAYSGDNADPNLIGIPNLMKYALGMRASTASVTGLPVLGRQVIGGKTYLTLSFAMIRALTDVTYTVQVSMDLKTWQEGPSYTLRTDNGTTDQAIYRDLTAIEDSSHRFMRLVVARP